MLAATKFQFSGIRYVHETSSMSICVALLRTDVISATVGSLVFSFSHDLRRLTISEAAVERKTRGEKVSFGGDSGQTSGIGTIGVSSPRLVLIYGIGLE
jgi:hypothetical protein